MINDEDIKQYDLFSRVIDEGKFDIEGRAVIQTALLMQWFKTLRPKLLSAKNSIEANPVPTDKIKEMPRPSISKKKKPIAKPEDKT